VWVYFFAALTKPKEKLDVKNLNPMQDNNAFSSLNKKTQKPTNQQQVLIISKKLFIFLKLL